MSDFDVIIIGAGHNGLTAGVELQRAGKKVLILDDSTSSVDLNTEYQIQKALDKLMEGRTSFVIAQRISTVLNADQILVLEHGRIAAQGTHGELMQSSPLYQEIYESQLGSGITAGLDLEVTQ